MNLTAQQEILHMLQANISPPDIVRTIMSEPCPYRQEELTLALQHCWRELENTFDERAVYQIDDQWGSRWPTIQDTIHTLLQQARTAQLATTPTIPTTTQIVKPTKPITMAFIINKQEGTINNYDHCTFYTTKHQPSSRTQNQETEVEEVPTIPAFFRTDSQSISEIEKRWNKALEENTKTKVIRAVMQQDYHNGYFRLANLTHQERAEEFNKAQNKFVFNASDFENANRK